MSRSADIAQRQARQLPADGRVLSEQIDEFRREPPARRRTPNETFAALARARRDEAIPADLAPYMCAGLWRWLKRCEATMSTAASERTPRGRTRGPAEPEHRFTMRPLAAEESGGFLTEYREPPGSISDGETLEEAIVNGREARAEWLTAMREAGRAGEA